MQAFIFLLFQSLLLQISIRNEAKCCCSSNTGHVRTFTSLSSQTCSKLSRKFLEVNKEWRCCSSGDFSSWFARTVCKVWVPLPPLANCSLSLSEASSEAAGVRMRRSHLASRNHTQVCSLNQIKLDCLIFDDSWTQVGLLL